MQGHHLYEYAVVRIVPQVEREEFLNVGVVLFCARRKYLCAITSLDEARLGAFSPVADPVALRAYLAAFCGICSGADAGAIARLPLAERFRWLTATRSTVVQTSRVHPGFCIDPAITLHQLFEQLVAMPAGITAGL